MKKFSLLLGLQATDDAGEKSDLGLPAVQLRESSQLAAVLWYALALLKKIGCTGDFSAWIKFYDKEIKK